MPTRARSTSFKDELIDLGHNWYLHNPDIHSVRLRYEAIDEDHPSLLAAEASTDKIARVLLRQIHDCRVTIVPCLHRNELPGRDDVLGAVLHVTTVDTGILDIVYLLQSDVPVHLYFGEPLATATAFDAYNPDRVALPSRLAPGDPLFCSATQRAVVFGAYLHAPANPDALYGLTVGQAVLPHTGFDLHPLLKRRSGQHTSLSTSSSSLLVFKYVARPLSNPATEVVERAIRALVKESERIIGEVERTGAAALTPLAQRRVQQNEAECAKLGRSLANAHAYDVGHVYAAEALVRPCSGHGDPRKKRKSSHPHRIADERVKHLLSWTLISMSASKANDNPVTLHPYPSAPERGDIVSMHVSDPNVERPLGPYRDGVVNGASARVVIGGCIALEWTVFPAPGRGPTKFAARGDAGAIVTSTLQGDSEGCAVTVPLGMLYAVPERGPYGLVTPITTIIRRIETVTGMQLRFQGSWWREHYT
ncbi:hypothetical protein C8Q80DRAFT_199932 [Daedaleopsis nitida]|nr:hypothetical protein C8Q80DRAFT_199932 [Daedaleopsis nitida]